MNEQETLTNLIKQKAKLVAMLAPSFPIVFAYPTVITMLKKCGFSYTVEVAVGAKKTNEQILKLLLENPTSRYITSPCPTIVRMVKAQMPQYAKYFPPGVDSPMIATAKIIRDKYPGYRPVFIGPCFVKKYEALEDVPELDILVLTYTELQQVFDHFHISDESNAHDTFDLSEPGMTRIYALDGGLSHSSGLSDKLQKEEMRIVSGVERNIEAIQEFDTNPKIRLLDILNCEGGCVGGPGIESGLSQEKRITKIHSYIDSQITHTTQ